VSDSERSEMELTGGYSESANAATSGARRRCE